jgi:putative oxidoreductase
MKMILDSISKMQSEEIMEEKCCGEYRCPHGVLPFLGRLLISLIFIIAGIGKIVGFREAVESLRNAGVGGAFWLIIIGLLMELVGGILLLIGWYTRVAIVILMIFLLPTTFIFHSFWNFTGAEATLQLLFFLKNLTIYGGLLAFFSFGPGRWSIDGCCICERCG